MVAEMGTFVCVSNAVFRTSNRDHDGRLQRQMIESQPSVARTIDSCVTIKGVKVTIEGVRSRLKVSGHD